MTPRWIRRAGIGLQLAGGLVLVGTRLAGVGFPWQLQLGLACAIVSQTVLMYAGPSRRRPADPPPAPRVVEMRHWAPR